MSKNNPDYGPVFSYKFPHLFSCKIVIFLSIIKESKKSYICLQVECSIFSNILQLGRLVLCVMLIVCDTNLANCSLGHLLSPSTKINSKMNEQRMINLQIGLDKGTRSLIKFIVYTLQNGMVCVAVSGVTALEYSLKSHKEG